MWNGLSMTSLMNSGANKAQSGRVDLRQLPCNPHPQVRSADRASLQAIRRSLGPDPDTMNRSFWKGRRVFLTGHTGFKGSWLSLWLEALGAEVTGYALPPPTQPNLFEQAGVANSLRSTLADIRDFDRLKKAIGDSRPEVVIHMAAQSVVRRGYEDPIETYSTNVMGTVNLFEALRQL